MSIYKPRFRWRYGLWGCYPLQYRGIVYVGRTPGEAWECMQQCEARRASEERP